MTGSGAGPAGGVDTPAPDVARICGCILGGKDNVAAGRPAAQQLLAALPGIAGTVRGNRAFTGRVVRFLAGQAGIRQFPDLGAGLPARDCVHEMAQAIAPDARVAYVDNDPVACSHGQALPGPRDRAGFVPGDLRRPGQILRHPGVLARTGFSRPADVLCACAPALRAGTGEAASGHRRVPRSPRAGQLPGHHARHCRGGPGR